MTNIIFTFETIPKIFACINILFPASWLLTIMAFLLRVDLSLKLNQYMSIRTKRINSKLWQESILLYEFNLDNLNILCYLILSIFVTIAIYAKILSTLNAVVVKSLKMNILAFTFVTKMRIIIQLTVY